MVDDSICSGLNIIEECKDKYEIYFNELNITDFCYKFIGINPDQKDTSYSYIRKIILPRLRSENHSFRNHLFIYINEERKKLRSCSRQKKDGSIQILHEQ